MEAQQGCYELPAAPAVLAVLNARIEVLRQDICRISSTVDVGWSDRVISAAYLKSGLVRRFVGFDLEGISSGLVDGLTFRAANPLDLELPEQHDPDRILVFDVLHDAIVGSPEGAQVNLDYALFRCRFVCADLGSPREDGDWGWLTACRDRWSSGAGCLRRPTQDSDFSAARRTVVCASCGSPADDHNG